MYGAAGAFRPKPYGVEYRVLSNAWLLTEDRMRFVYKQTVKAVKDLMSGNRFSSLVLDDELRRAINTSTMTSHYIQHYLPNGYAVYQEAMNL